MITFYSFHSYYSYKPCSLSSSLCNRHHYIMMFNILNGMFTCSPCKYCCHCQWPCSCHALLLDCAVLLLTLYAVCAPVQLYPADVPTLLLPCFVAMAQLVGNEALPLPRQVCVCVGGGVRGKGGLCIIVINKEMCDESEGKFVLWRNRWAMRLGHYHDRWGGQGGGGLCIIFDS